MPERIPTSGPPITMLYPIWFAYLKNASAALEHEIFPSYFHGKCQRPDPHNPGGPPVNPPGCPNPDCPVVCGTPGSMVHFFTKLKHIAFNTIQNLLSRLLDPKSKEFKEVLKIILQEAEGSRRLKERRSWIGRRGISTREVKLRRAEEARIVDDTKQVLSQVLQELDVICGGSETLTHCSWEVGMKTYILSFP
jgi:hypothetical protein